MPPHGCDGHSHDHEHAESDDTNPSLGTSLRPSIDFHNVVCLNESRPNSGRDVLKLHEDRLSSFPSLLSQEDPDEEPELLLIVPFVEAVTIRSVCVLSHAHRAPRSSSSSEVTTTTAPPRTLRVYANRPNLDFETVRDLDPDATIMLVPPSHQWDASHATGTIDYPLRPAGRFHNVSEIALYFGDNYGVDVDDDGHDTVQTEITYVGFKGKGTNVRRRAVEAVYETMGMKADHKQPGNEYFARQGL
ncbi:hypothetical protein ACHAW5_000839 [Stephanodiscus triporus]|uniref:PITH domain-containing protein n=1 Tax=Stephanodiscus triporus TaxID=2934178 RepID=A0ABD3NY64_9STRA